MSIFAAGSVYGPEQSYTKTGGFLSPPNMVGVSDWLTSRIGTFTSPRRLLT